MGISGTRSRLEGVALNSGDLRTDREREVKTKEGGGSKREETLDASSFALAAAALTCCPVINGATNGLNGGWTTPLTVICLTRLYAHVESLTDKSSRRTPGTSMTTVSVWAPGSYSVSIRMRYLAAGLCGICGDACICAGRGEGSMDAIVVIPGEGCPSGGGLGVTER